MCIHWWQIKHIDNVDNYGKTNNTNVTPIVHIKIFYKNKGNVCAFLFVFVKNIIVYYIKIYLSLFQVLSDVRTAVHGCEHVSAGRCRTNACVINSTIGLSVPNSFTIQKISWKYLEVLFLGDFQLAHLFCKISIKGQAAQLKVKTATKLRKFSSIEISTLRNRILK